MANLLATWLSHLTCPRQDIYGNFASNCCWVHRQDYSYGDVPAVVEKFDDPLQAMPGKVLNAKTKPILKRITNEEIIEYKSYPCQ